MALTLSYSAPSELRRQTALFVKLNPHDSRDAPRYRFLHARGLPVPNLEVCAERDSEEVLVLQFLPSIGVAPPDVDEVLRLAAVLNSVADMPETIGNTPSGLPQAQFEHLLTQALDEVGAAHPNQPTHTWLNTCRRAVPLYRNLPTALTHGELAPQQLGRTRGGALVIFDLATLGRRPRFADIAGLLATLAQLAGQDERAIVGDYLGHLAPGVGATGAEQTWAEPQLTRFVRAVEALPWHLSLRRPDDLDQHLEAIAADHRATLAQLAP